MWNNSVPRVVISTGKSGTDILFNPTLVDTSDVVVEGSKISEIPWSLADKFSW